MVIKAYIRYYRKKKGQLLFAVVVLILLPCKQKSCVGNLSTGQGEKIVRLKIKL